MKTKYATILYKVKIAHQGPTLQLPNNTTITEAKSGILNLNVDVSSKTNIAHVFYGLNSASLVSLVQICDDYYIAILDKN